MEFTDEGSRMIKMQVATTMMVAIGCRVQLTRTQMSCWMGALLILTVFSAHGKCPYRDSIVCLGMLALAYAAKIRLDNIQRPAPN
jgi:hypothetical protein